MSAPAQDHPLCARCGDRIGMYERMWFRQADGTLVASSLLSLDADAMRQPDREFFHLRCVDPGHLVNATVSPSC